MALPKIEYPIIEIELGGKKRKFRAMLVKDEKVLLTAREGQNDAEIFTAIKQVVTNCNLEDGFDIDDLPIFELEYAFLRLRMASIGDTLDLTYRDSEDEKDYNFNIKIDDIKIKYPDPLPSKTIDVGNGVGIALRYPPASLYSDPAFIKSDGAEKYFERILAASVVNIYDDEQVYENTEAELLEFLDNLDSKTYRKIQDFLSNVPHMEHVIKYTNKKGTEREIVLSSLTDFFTL